jgi:hypothetical protein
MRSRLQHNETVIGFQFENREGCIECLSLYYDRFPDGYFAAAGHNAIVVSERAGHSLRDELGVKGIAFRVVPVVSIADLPEDVQLAVARRRDDLSPPLSHGKARKVLHRRYDLS